MKNINNVGFMEYCMTNIDGAEVRLRCVGEGWAAHIDWMAENPGETVVVDSTPLIFLCDDDGNRYAAVRTVEVANLRVVRSTSIAA
jgi:hypothetical protein